MIAAALLCLLPARAAPGAAPEPATPPAVEAPAEPGPGADELADLEARLAAVEARLDALEAGGAGLAEEPTAEAVEADGSAPDLVRWDGAVEVPEGEVVGEAVSYTGPVVVRGTVRGDAVSFASDVRVTATGRVEGDAVSFGGGVTVDPGGRVDGDRVALGRDGSALTGAFTPARTGMALVHGIARRLALLLAAMGIGVLVAGLWPDRVERIAERLAQRPFWYGVAGAVLLGVGGLAGVAFALTIVGIPLTMVILALLGIGWLLGSVALCRLLGARLAPMEGRPSWAPFLVGAGLLAALGLVPGVGPVVLILAALPAVGAAVASRFGTPDLGA